MAIIMNDYTAERWVTYYILNDSSMTVISFFIFRFLPYGFIYINVDEVMITMAMIHALMNDCVI